MLIPTLFSQVLNSVTMVGGERTQSTDIVTTVKSHLMTLLSVPIFLFFPVYEWEMVHSHHM